MEEEILRNTPQNAPAAGRAIKRLGIWLLLPLLAGLIVLCVFSWEWRESLKIQRIVVEGIHLIPAQEIFTMAGIPSKSRMYGVDLFEVRRKILAQPFVKSVAVLRQYPDALRLCIEERNPIASVNNGELLYVDAEGALMPFQALAAKLDLPIISNVDGLQKTPIGEPVANKELHEAIALLQTAQAIDTSLFHFISEVNMNEGRDITLYSTDIGVPIIVGRGDIGKKLVTLQSFWSNFAKSDRAQQLRYIDLRYEDQVIVKWQKENQPAQQTKPLL